MVSIVKRAESAPEPESDLERRFLAVNAEKLRRLYDNLSSRQRELVDALPLLFHTNHRSLPGFVSKDVPDGVCDYVPDRSATSAVQRMAATFRYVPTNRHEPRIKGLYLMGSPGTVGFSKSSDLDIWLVHDPALDEAEVRALKAKARKIEQFAAAIDLEIHFFVFDAVSFRSGRTLNLSAESSGSSQHHLLVDEFYRSGLLLAGLKPVWWRVLPSDERHYDEVVADAIQSGKIAENDYVDFGGLAHIPANEFFGVAVWHLYKSIESPYKSLLKLLLMETYASEYPDGKLLSHGYKDTVFEGNLAVTDVDPYIAMFRKVEEHLTRTRDEARLDLTRRSFYIKTDVNITRTRDASIPDWQRSAIDEIVRSWQWSRKELLHLDDRANWKVPSALKERRVLIKALGQSYAALSKFAKRHSRDHKITQTDLNVLGRKLYAAFERKPSKVDIVTRGICPDPVERELSLHAQYTKEGEATWSLYRGGVSPEQARTAKPLLTARAPTELLSWCHFNHLYDNRTNWRIYDAKQNVGQGDVRKALEAIDRSYPNGNIRSEDNGTLGQAPRPLNSLLLINMGTNPLSTRLRDKGVLISDRTDAFQFGGKGINLVQSADLLMMTSWEEVLVFSFEGSNGLLDALMEYMQWATPLGSVDLPLLKICCLSRDHSHTIQRRVEEYTKNVIELLCRPQGGVDRQFITQFEQQYCRVFAKNNRPQYEFHRNLAGLTNALGIPKAKFSDVRIDAGCTDLGVLSAIYAANKPGRIQLFVLESGKEAAVFIIDEYGALFTQRQECFRIEIIFDQYAQFLQNLLKHHVQRVDSEGRLSGQPTIETFRLQPQSAGVYQTAAVSVPAPRGVDYFSVRVFVDVHKGGKQQFTIFCEDEEFSSAQFGGRLFIAIAEHILTRRGNAETYPIYITDLELSNRFKKYRNIDTLQTIHVLNYKKRIEQQLTRALRFDLAGSRGSDVPT